MMLRVGIIYLITYPNGKIYIGQDRTDDINYFGSADSFTIRNDFDPMQCDDLTVRKQVLVRREMIAVRELNKLEREYIAKFKSSDPDIGYNRTGFKRRVARTVWHVGSTGGDSP